MLRLLFTETYVYAEPDRTPTSTPKSERRVYVSNLPKSSNSHHSRSINASVANVKKKHVTAPNRKRNTGFAHQLQSDTDDESSRTASFRTAATEATDFYSDEYSDVHSITSTNGDDQEISYVIQGDDPNLPQLPPETMDPHSTNVSSKVDFDDVGNPNLNDLRLTSADGYDLLGNTCSSFLSDEPQAASHLYYNELRDSESSSKTLEEKSKEFDARTSKAALGGLKVHYNKKEDHSSHRIGESEDHSRLHRQQPSPSSSSSVRVADTRNNQRGFFQLDEDQRSETNTDDDILSRESSNEAIYQPTSEFDQVYVNDPYECILSLTDDDEDDDDQTVRIKVSSAFFVHFQQMG